MYRASSVLNRMFCIHYCWAYCRTCLSAFCDVWMYVIVVYIYYNFIGGNINWLCALMHIKPNSRCLILNQNFLGLCFKFFFLQLFEINLIIYFKPASVKIHIYKWCRFYWKSVHIFFSCLHMLGLGRRKNVIRF